MITTVMSEVTRLYDLPSSTDDYNGTWGRSYKRVTSEMTVLIIGTWGRSYKRVTSDITVLISGTWGRSYRRVTSEITVLICLKLHVYMTYPKHR
jgi:pyruvate/oxaloacetate carboxyltransferase